MSALRTPRSRPAVIRYGAAVVVVVLGLTVGLALRPHSFTTPFLFFYFPVLFAIWYGGFWPGVTATVLSAALTDYFFLPPFSHFSVAGGALLRSGFFAAAFVLTAWLVETRRREAESELAAQIAALRASEARLRLAHKAARIGSFEWNVQTGVNIWSPELEAMYGLAVGEFGKTQTAWEELVHIEDRATAVAKVRQAFETGEPAEGEWRVVWRDGSVHWIFGRFQVFNDPAGQPLTLNGVNIDITERKHVDDALRISEGRLSGIIDAAMDAIITVDEQQQVVVFNRSAEKVFECSASEAIGKPLERFLPERFREVHREHIRHFGATGITSRSVRSQSTLVGLRRTGEEFPIEAEISQIEAGGHKLYTVILRDITQRLQTERALIQSEKLATLGRLGAAVAHEVNNPLDIIANVLYLLDNDPATPESIREYVHLLQAEVNRAGQIIKHTLGFSKGGAMEGPLRVTEVVNAVMSLAKRKLEQKAVVCEKQILGDAEIIGVAAEVQQVLWNLLTNALDATDPGGTIKVRVRVGHKPLAPLATGVFVTIADSGAGIDREHLSRIFEPFYTTKPYGNGLGLWVSKQIIDKHKGSLRVRSQTSGPRAGTVFSIFFPSA